MVYISPLRFGTGMENKGLEAMAMGKPIVATSKSLTGITSKNGESLLIADDPKDFVQKIILL